MTKKQRENEKVIALIFFTAIIIVIIILGLIWVFESSFFLEESGMSQYTTSYETINVSVAKELIESHLNLTVIDYREGCGQCQFNKGHLPGAVLNDNPMTLYNSTNDILVYSVDGGVGAGFCEQLVDHTYGKIYNLEGGYNAWIASEE